MYRRFDPARHFEYAAKKMNEFAGEFEKGFSVEFGGFNPRVDITEDEKNLLLYVELPGVNKDDVKVSVNEENLLFIKGDKKKAKADDKSFIRTERNFGEFSRSFMLPDTIDRDSIKAKYENGILEITLQKKEPAKPKEVEVNIS